MFNPYYCEHGYIENDFIEIANKILNQMILIINGRKFRICEIEMYLKSSNHPDNYTHSNPDQKSFGKFYFHKYSNGTFKSGTWKGVDIVLGNETKYFGILIRSMVELDQNFKPKFSEFIEGPCKCVNKLLEQFGLTEVSQLFLQEFPNQNQISFESELNIKLELDKNNNLSTILSLNANIPSIYGKIFNTVKSIRINKRFKNFILFYYLSYLFSYFF